MKEYLGGVTVPSHSAPFFGMFDVSAGTLFLFSRYELLFLVGIFDFVGLLSSFCSLPFNFGIATWQSTINIDSLGLDLP